MNKLTQLLGAVAVVAICFVFVLQFRPGTGAKVVDGGPACVAEVRGTCIPKHFFDAAYRIVTMRTGDAQGLRTNKAKEVVANGLIEMQLLNDDAARLGIAVSDDDVSREFVTGRVHVSVPASNAEFAQRVGIADARNWVQFLSGKGKSKKFETKTFEKTVRNFTRLSPTDFRAWQKQELVAARMRDIVRARAHVSEDEVFEQFSREKSTVTIDYVKFDAQWLSEIVDTSQKKIDEWAEKNQELVNKTWESRKNNYLPECRVTRHMLVKVDETTANDEEKAAAKKKIEAALERVKKGEDFAKVANDVSEDVGMGSRKGGGELGCVQKGQMVKPFEDAMLTLGAGQVSGVVTTQYGYHILKVDQVASGADAEKVGRAQIAKEFYLKTEISRLAAEGSKEVLAAVRGGKTMQDAVATYLTEVLPKTPAKTDDAAGGDDKGDKAGTGDKKDKKKKDKKGDADKKGDGEDKGDDKADHGPASSPLRPQVETSLPFPEKGEAIPGARGPNEVAKVAFSLKKAGDVPDDVIQYDSGFVVIQLKERIGATHEEFAKNREPYMNRERAMKQQDALAAYMKRLLANVEAKPNPLVVAEPKASAGAPEGEVPMMPGPDDEE